MFMPVIINHLYHNPLCQPLITLQERKFLIKGMTAGLAAVTPFMYMQNTLQPTNFSILNNLISICMDFLCFKMTIWANHRFGLCFQVDMFYVLNFFNFN